MVKVSRNYLGGGGYGDVYVGECDLRGPVAVKIIRPDMAERVPALAQANALMRAIHPNVVAVFNVERVVDPESGKKVDGIIMELLEGPKLDVILAQKKLLSRDEATKLGQGIVAGMNQIHTKGLAHGDFHEGNVLVVDGNAKIIDILYTASLALMSTDPRERRVQNDIRSVRLVLRQILQHTENGDDLAIDFIRATSTGFSLKALAEAFTSTLQQNDKSSRNLRLRSLVQQIADESFVNTDAYASALLEETPKELAWPVLEHFIDANACRRAHKHFVQKLFGILAPKEKHIFVAKLSSSLNKEVPRGSWSSSLRLLRYTVEETWDMMPKTTLLKLESQIADDILAGRRNAYGVALNVGGGMLGTWALQFWKRLSDKDTIIDNIASMLTQNWDMQNYIGEHFMSSFERMATTKERKDKLVRGLQRAYADNAFVVKQNLDKLPSDWVDEVLKK